MLFGQLDLYKLTTIYSQIGLLLKIFNFSGDGNIKLKFNLKFIYNHLENFQSILIKLKSVIELDFAKYYILLMVFSTDSALCIPESKLISYFRFNVYFIIPTTQFHMSLK